MERTICTETKALQNTKTRIFLVSRRLNEVRVKAKLGYLLVARRWVGLLWECIDSQVLCVSDLFAATKPPNHSQLMYRQADVLSIPE